VIKHSIPWALTLGVTAAATAAASPTIERLAPDDSILIISVDNFQQALARFKKTPMWALWQSEQIQAMLAEPLEACSEELDDALQELGLDSGSLAAPEGPVGFALFPPPMANPEMGPGFLLTADFGAQAFKINRVIDAVIANAQAEHDVEFDERNFLGRTVYSLDLSGVDFDSALEMEEPDFGPMSPMPPMPGPGDVVGAFDQLHYVRDGRRFMVSSSLGALRGALEVIDEDGHSRLAEHPGFQGARAQLGPVDAYGVLLMGNLGRLVGGGDPMFMMVQGMFQSLVGDIRALAFGVRFDGPTAMVEETFAVYMPDGTSGLTALVDTGTPRRDVPSFVGPDAIAYSRMNFEFDGVPGFLRAIGQTNPMLGPQIDQFLFNHGATVDEVCNSLGPEVHSVATLTRPVRLSSLKTLYAIQSSRPDQVEAVLAEYAPQMGMQPRDFVGHRIYSLAFDPFMAAAGMMPGGDAEGFSIGFGGGYVMLGTTSLVEDGLRAAGRAGVPTLADDPAHRRAISALSQTRVVAWGVIDVVDYVEFFADIGDLTHRQVIEQVKQWDPEYAQEMQRELDAQEPMPWENLDPELLRQYIGPVSWQIQARQDGFVGKYLLLAPAQEATAYTED
jgi:hypothetical protein